jgi:WD40 repeat protein
VVTASKDGTARVWNASSGASIGSPLAHPPTVAVQLAAFSPDGATILTTASDYKVRLWDAASNQPPLTLSGHADRITSAMFSPDGTLVLTSSHDRTARIWDVATGTLAVPALLHTEGVLSAALSPDATRVVTVSDVVQVWDARTGRLLSPHFSHSSRVSNAVFSPDGNSLMTVSRGAVRIWNGEGDMRTLDHWYRIARGGSYPQLVEQLNLGGVPSSAAR